LFCKYKIETVDKDYYDGIIVVYNFEVEDNHNYYVGDNQVLVHNDGCTVSDKGSSSDGDEGSGNPVASNVAEFEKLRASYAADEIINAERTSTTLTKSDPAHLSGSFLTREQLAAGKVTGIKGGDGIQRTLLQTKGKLNGESGIFEYIITPDGKVSHQRFIQGRKYTGYPNQVVPKGGY